MAAKETDNSLETDIALIKKDIRQIERVFKKVDDAIAQMSEILRDLAVQETVLENNEKRLELIEQKLILHTEEEKTMREEFRKELKEIKEGQNAAREARHKELIQTITNMHQDLNSKLEKQDKRIRDLENWRWYMLGIGAVLFLLVTKFPWALLFG